jgi:hypothetical protein|tara:strand:+ start:126 stop:332 length:207 start_codon:yes stop_codon:yes gene_type:complete
MWIPVIIIAWSIGGGATWVNFPMVNFPFTSLDKCQEYVARVRSSITLDPQYLEGYSVCVEVPTKGESV